MHLAVDAHNALTDRRGIGVYARAILPRLGALPGMRITLLVRDWWPARLQRRLIAAFDGWDGFAVARRVPRAVDLVFHPWNGTFFTSAHPAVATIHDCAPFAFPAVVERQRRREQEPFRRSAHASRRIITDSYFSAGEIERYLGVDESRIDVVHLATDDAFGSTSEAMPIDELRRRPYLLFVGAPDHRKNLATLVAAWRETFPSRDVALVCVSSATVTEAISFHDVSVQMLRTLYTNALCFVMPSMYEGFGLPALEAMRCGAPVLASRAASLPEVCGTAARYVDDPLDIAAWAAALREIAGDANLRTAMRERGREQAARFSWERVAHETHASFERALAG